MGNSSLLDSHRFTHGIRIAWRYNAHPARHLTYGTIALRAIPNA
ncbi:hypothetical protein HPTD01_2282 [Halomonas sp. TD01]|nr:hypothetical protein HPTD01_2282 [Halomonas sp. TD01]